MYTVKQVFSVIRKIFPIFSIFRTKISYVERCYDTVGNLKILKISRHENFPLYSNLLTRENHVIPMTYALLQYKPRLLRIEQIQSIHL